MSLGNCARSSYLAVYLIINGTLGMSAGKIAAQSFQAAQRLFLQAQNDVGLAELLEQWQAGGTCTRVRIAQTPAVFERACRELPGAMMVDEGMTEVSAGSATCYATAPIEEEALPRILRHKRMPVLNATVTHVSVPESSRRSSEVELRELNPLGRRFDSDRLLVRPAREAELAQHRSDVDGTPSAQVLAVCRAEVAGSNPAASLAHSGHQPRSPFIG